MNEIKQHNSSDYNWVNELPLEEFDNDNEDFTNILEIPLEEVD